MTERETVKTFSLGRIQANVLLSSTENGGRWYSTRIVRKYWDGQEEKEATSFFPEDLSVVIQAAQKADDWIREQKGATAPKEEAVA